MAVTEVRITTDDRGGRFGQRNERAFTLSYLITTDSRHDGPITVLGSLPQIGDVYATDNESDLGARASDIDLKQIAGDPYHWRATVTFSPVHGEDPDDPEPESPGDRDPVYSVRFQKRQVPVAGPYSTADPGNQDATTALANSAGQPFNPPITRDETRPVIVIQVNDDNLDLPGIAAIQDTVNKDAFAGYTSQTLKLNVSGVQEFFEDGRRWWRKVYELEHKRSSWLARPLDYGTVEDEDGNVRETLLNNSSPTTGPPQYLGPFTLYRQIAFATHADIPEAIKQLGQAPA